MILTMKNFKTKEKMQKLKIYKNMSSLQNEISLEHKESKPEFDPYFYNNIINILNLKKELE